MPCSWAHSDAPLRGKANAFQPRGCRGERIVREANTAHNLRGTRGDKRYIWQAEDWPHWRYRLPELAASLEQVSRAQGRLLGRLADVGMALRDQASLEALTDDVVKTSAIEGESLNVASVRSSIARRLGVDIGALAPVDRHAEGVVEMVLDATGRAHEPLDEERLCKWATIAECSPESDE